MGGRETRAAACKRHSGTPVGRYCGRSTLNRNRVEEVTARRTTAPPQKYYTLTLRCYYSFYERFNFGVKLSVSTAGNHKLTPRVYNFQVRNTYYVSSS